MGGGGGYFSGKKIDRTLKNVKQAGSDADSAEYQASTNGYLNGLLTSFNNRDVDATSRHLAEIESALEKIVDGTIALRFGGSVAKHTYVDGLSDVDALLIISDRAVQAAGPEAALEFLAGRLSERFPRTNVSIGRLAVTLKFADMEVQLVPALEGAQGRVRIPAANGREWAEIDPRGFAEKLTAVNQQNASKVVPVVKLAKAIIAKLPRPQQVTGYHAEALAVEVFSDYRGPTTTKDMLQHFFRTGANRVQEPIRDSTGQSIHVDDYLGDSGSLERQIASSGFARIARRMQHADTGGRLDDWKSFFGDL